MNPVSPVSARRCRRALLVGALAGASALLLWRLAPCEACQPAPAPPSPLVHPAPQAPGDAPAPPAVDGKPAAPAALAQWEQRLFGQGPLRGTDAPPWGTARGAPLLPNRALRDRFDHYLLGQAELALAELTALLQAHAERDLGTETAAQVLEIWQRYLNVQRHPFRFVARADDPAATQLALQEHRQVRQSLLGLHWAQAFYGEEEAQLSADLEQRLAGAAPAQRLQAQLLTPPTPEQAEQRQRQRVEQFGREAARKLAELDEEEARWARRIAAAQQQADAIRANAALSAPQRDAELQRMLAQAFREPSERLRAQGLLGL